MNDPFCRQGISPGNFRLPGFASSEGAAFLQEFRACRPVDRPVYPSSPEQAVICGIHDRVNFLYRNVAPYNLDPRLKHEIMVSFVRINNCRRSEKENIQY
jgi:hypothetical protein